MKIRMARLEERLPVNLSVKYSVAKDFVVEYAENLSVGGLFVRGASDLERGQQVNVQIMLPGFGEFEVTAEVAHVLPPEVAEKYERKAGAGFAITKTPRGFDDALRSYLLRLGQRRDHVVLVGQMHIAVLLEKAGYRVRPLPAPDKLLEAISTSDEPVIGVVVPYELEQEFVRRALSMGAPEMIYATEDGDDLDELLSWLDNELFGA